jgi:hypothetical protein
MIAVGANGHDSRSCLLLAQRLRRVSEQRAERRGASVTGYAVGLREQFRQLALDGRREPRAGGRPITVGDRCQVTVEDRENRRLVTAGGLMPECAETAVGARRRRAAGRAGAAARSA